MNKTLLPRRNHNIRKCLRKSKNHFARQSVSGRATSHLTKIKPPVRTENTLNSLIQLLQFQVRRTRHMPWCAPEATAIARRDESGDWSGSAANSTRIGSISVSMSPETPSWQSRFFPHVYKSPDSAMKSKQANFIKIKIKHTVHCTDWPLLCHLL
jgi:hypothetical protein